MKLFQRKQVKTSNEFFMAKQPHTRPQKAKRKFVGQ